MCIFCEIVSGKREELPWAGNDPVDEYLERGKWIDSLSGLHHPEPGKYQAGSIRPGAYDKRPLF